MKPTISEHSPQSYYAVIIAAEKGAKDKRPKRYQFYAYDDTHAYKQFAREHMPDFKYRGAYKKVLSIEPITQEQWESTVDNYSVNYEW